jgi:hypothetical protein
MNTDFRFVFLIFRQNISFSQSLGYNNMLEVHSRMKDNKKSYLPKDYQPSPIDVICGRGVKCFHHSGNVIYRNVLETFEDCYKVAQTKIEKSNIVLEVIREMRSNIEYPRKFIRWCNQRKAWYEVSERDLRQKVGQTLRDSLIMKNPQKRSFKNDEAAFLKSLRCIDFTSLDGTVKPHNVVSNNIHQDEGATKSSDSLQDRDNFGISKKVQHSKSQTSYFEFPELWQVCKVNQDCDMDRDLKSNGNEQYCLQSLKCHLNLPHFELPDMWQESKHPPHEGNVENDESDLSSIGWWESGFDHYS